MLEQLKAQLGSWGQGDLAGARWYLRMVTVGMDLDGLSVFDVFRVFSYVSLSFYVCVSD